MENKYPVVDSVETLIATIERVRKAQKIFRCIYSAERRYADQSFFRFYNRCLAGKCH